MIPAEFAKEGAVLMPIPRCENFKLGHYRNCDGFLTLR
jgi:hypothetical protein